MSGLLRHTFHKTYHFKVYNLVRFDKCIQSCSHYNKYTFSLPSRNSLCSFAVGFLPANSTPKPTDLFSVPIVLTFVECNINGIIEYSGGFCVWLLSLNIMLLRFIHVVACMLFLKNCQVMFYCTDVILFIHSLNERDLSYLQFSAIFNELL